MTPSKAGSRKVSKSKQSGKRAKKKKVADRSTGTGSKSRSDRKSPDRRTRKKSATSPGKTGAPARAKRATPGSSRKTNKGRESRRLVNVGIDLGNFRAVVAASKSGECVDLKRDIFPSVIGYLKLGARLDELPSNDAWKLCRRLNLTRPIRAGVVADVNSCRELVAHLCSTVNSGGSQNLRGVVSAPARATPEEQDRVSRAVRGVLEQSIVVAEPYLVAEGMQLDSGFQRSGNADDLTTSSLVIDIGATTTELCLVRGELAAFEQISLEKAGHWVDKMISANALFRCPGLSLTPRLAVKIKEEQAFVTSEAATSAGPGPDLVELTAVIRAACEELLRVVAEASRELLGRCDPESAARSSRNIILTGGGSRIRGFPSKLEASLRAMGYEQARVMVPQDYRRLVARGAVRFADRLTDEEWEELSTLSWRTHSAPPGKARSEAPPEASLLAVPDNTEEIAESLQPETEAEGAEPTPGLPLEKNLDGTLLEELKLCGTRPPGAEPTAARAEVGVPAVPGEPTPESPVGKELTRTLLEELELYRALQPQEERENEDTYSLLPEFCTTDEG